MDTFELITHPIKLEKLENQNILTVVSRESFGPIGLCKFVIQSRSNLSQIELRSQLQAHPFCFVSSTPIAENYLATDYQGMCSLFLKLYLGEYPDSFETHKFAQPATTHLYPVYSSEYLYVCQEERRFLDSCYGDIHSFLGLKAVTHDPLCWINMKVENAIMWSGGCVVPVSDQNQPRTQTQIRTRTFSEEAETGEISVQDFSEEKLRSEVRMMWRGDSISSEMGFLETERQISATLRYMERARRRGYRATVTSVEDDEDGLLHPEMRYGPVVFTYHPELDLERRTDKPSPKQIGMWYSPEERRDIS